MGTSKRFADVLKGLRQSKGLSQLELSRELGMSLSSIGMYETGQREPNKEAEEKLCKYFNCDLNYLYGKSEILNSYHKRENVSQISFFKKYDGSNMEADEIIVIPDFLLDHNKYYFAVLANDDSMLGSGIKEGDMIVFERCGVVSTGEIGYFITSGKSVCRKYYTENKKTYLLATNDNYPNITVKKLNCLGKLVLKISKQ